MPMLFGAAMGRGGALSDWVIYPSLWNPSDLATGAALSVSNRRLTSSSSATGGARAATAVVGKMFWHIWVTGNAANSACVGIGTAAATITKYPGEETTSWGYYANNGTKVTNAGFTAYGSNYQGNNSIITVAFDSATGSLWFAKDGTWQASGNPSTEANAAFTGIVGPVFPMCSDLSGSTASVYDILARPANI